MTSSSEMRTGKYVEDIVIEGKNPLPISNIREISIILQSDTIRDDKLETATCNCGRCNNAGFVPDEVVIKTLVRGGGDQRILSIIKASHLIDFVQASTGAKVRFRKPPPTSNLFTPRDKGESSMVDELLSKESNVLPVSLRSGKEKK